MKTNDKITKIKKNMEYRKKIKEKLGEKVWDDMYENISYKELKEALDNAKWVMKNDPTLNSENSIILKSYQRQASIAGTTDYKNHKKTSIEELKKKIYKDIEDRLMQRLHYYNINGKIFDIVFLNGYNGGWDSTPGWSDGNDGFSSIA